MGWRDTVARRRRIRRADTGEDVWDAWLMLLGVVLALLAIGLGIFFGIKAIPIGVDSVPPISVLMGLAAVISFVLGFLVGMLAAVVVVLPFVGGFFLVHWCLSKSDKAIDEINEEAAPPVDS